MVEKKAEDGRTVDEVTGVETTGHSWDGVSELNNPMPRWWLSIFYATIVFSVIYMILFPAIPLIEDSTRGLLGYTAREEVAEKIVEHAEMQSVWRDRIAAASLDEIRQDPDLQQFAMASGRADFQLNCSQCHGSGAAGNPGGYPNLNDDAWIWGGTPEAIYTTIAHGVRNEIDPEARYSQMPAYGVDGLLSEAEIEAATQHVLAFTGRETRPELLELGAETWELNCSACHGAEGEGIAEVGAPRLNDAIWLYGGEPDDIRAQIWNPQWGVMPPWLPRLGDTAVKELAIYVHSLGGGVVSEDVSALR
jgi:cytochrome c oxidase cbb3-type subunit 3